MNNTGAHVSVQTSQKINYQLITGWQRHSFMSCWGFADCCSSV